MNITLDNKKYIYTVSDDNVDEQWLVKIFIEDDDVAVFCCPTNDLSEQNIIAIIKHATLYINARETNNKKGARK